MEGLPALSKTQPIGRVRTVKPPVTKYPKTPRPMRSFGATKTGTLIAFKSDFGKDSPRYTIGSSRPEGKPGYIYPGPGEYNPLQHDRKIPHVISKSPPPKPRVSLTANIDLYNASQFPSGVPISIPKSPRPPFYQENDMPGPSDYHIPNNTLSPRSHKISSGIYKEKLDNFPAPTDYNPMFDVFRHTPSFKFNEVKDRTSWMNAEETPGPGNYSPNHSITISKEPIFSFGAKSRPRTRRWASPEPPKKKKYAIGCFYVGIPEEEFSERYVNKYLANHTEIKDFIDEITEYVLENKPEDPISATRDYCIKLRENNVNEHN